MPLKLLQIIAPDAADANIRKLAADYDAVSFYKGVELDDDHAEYFLLSRARERQQLIDKLQDMVTASSKCRITILSVDATIPAPEAENSTGTREELKLKMEQGAHLDSTYTILTALSTVVALIGLINNNIAVVVGAMVIAPLLGPNLSFAFATSQGNTTLMWRAGQTALIGAIIAILMSAITGPFLQSESVFSDEVLSRTSVGLDGVALAFASGIAAVLSLTTGLSMTLVGVMVAVALLPPAAVLGLMIGAGQWGHAAGALELLIVNVVCVNFAGQLVFLFKGFRPRTWFERRLAKPYVWGGLIVWGLAFVLMTVFVQVEFF